MVTFLKLCVNISPRVFLHAIASCPLKEKSVLGRRQRKVEGMGARQTQVKNCTGDGTHRRHGDDGGEHANVRWDVCGASGVTGRAKIYVFLHVKNISVRFQKVLTVSLNGIIGPHG